MRQLHLISSVGSILTEGWSDFSKACTHSGNGYMLLKVRIANLSLSGYFAFKCLFAFYIPSCTNIRYLSLPSNSLCLCPCVRERRESAVSSVFKLWEFFLPLFLEAAHPPFLNWTLSPFQCLGQAVCSHAHLMRQVFLLPNLLVSMFLSVKT